MITDDTGQVRQRLGYDVWGNRVLDTNWTVRAEFDNGDFDYIFRRGFTGHEHLGSFGIINMNGRIYDPNIASFFSPDPFVVDATSTQAFNRYSYCLNNPMMYTDPSGEFIFSLFVPIVGPFLDAACWGAVIGGASYTASVAFSQGGFNNWNSGDFWKSVGVGAVSGAVTFGIGEAFAAAGNFAGEIGTELLRGAAHGLAQGGMSALQGGNFWQGFASGSLGSLAGSAFSMYGGDFANSTLGMYTFSAGMGGLGSVLTGGNFWEGAVQGLMVAGLNHLQHEAKLFSDKISGYKGIWETSLDKNGNFERETSGFELKGGKVLMLPNDKNTMYSSHNPYSIKGGKNYVTFEGRDYEITGHVHTHPTRPHLGVSREDIMLMNNLGLKSINIIQNRTLYQVWGLKNYQSIVRF